jgi:hypothetical protein
LVLVTVMNCVTVVCDSTVTVEVVVKSSEEAAARVEDSAAIPVVDEGIWAVMAPRPVLTRSRSQTSFAMMVFCIVNRSFDKRNY